DGSGKTTQAHLLLDRIHETEPGVRAFYTFEPTNNDIGRLIRQHLKGEISLDPKSLPYLFAADRAIHLYGEKYENYGILAQLETDHIICDRYVLS
ncbi:dTMP kinase, partial [Mangrovimonas sp. AS39]|nr:dTMP kinase [Mangrovimonas futianensis]